MLVHLGFILRNNMTFTKKYTDKNKKYSHLSSIENELYCINKFSRGGTNPYAPEVLSVGEGSYTMKKYKCRVGNYRDINGNIRRILFSISLEELFRQFDEILTILEEENIQHRDIFLLG